MYKSVDVGEKILFSLTNTIVERKQKRIPGGTRFEVSILLNMKDHASIGTYFAFENAP